MATLTSTATTVRTIPAKPPELEPPPPVRPRPPRRALFRAPSTPAKLRVATVAALCGLAVLLGAATAATTTARQGVGTVQREAARVATASDLYFALADMDTQAANILLIGHDEQIGNKQLALRTLRERRAQVSVDVQRLLSSGAGEKETATGRELLDRLAQFDALSAEAQQADARDRERAPGRPGTLALNSYTAATAAVHQDLLPAADSLRKAAAERLARAYREDGADARTGRTLILTFGLPLIGGLIVFQVWSARRFRRLLSPGLFAATVLTVAATLLTATTLAGHTDRLNSAESQGSGPSAVASGARATASAAYADAVRTVILPEAADRNRADFTTLTTGLTTPSTQVGQATLLRAFTADTVKLMDAAAAGRTETAVDLATTVARGKPGFSFFDYESTLGETAAADRAVFEEQTGAARDALSFYPLLPIVLLCAGAAGVVFGIRPRLREYR